MDGRQYFPGNYGGNYQQASDFNAASYPHVYQGMLGNYFAPGPHAATTQQLGGPALSTHMQFANQAAEDPALFVTFEEEDEDFPSTSRAAVARRQQMPFRRQPSQSAIGTQAANSRQQPPAGTVPQAPNRASSAGPVKTLSSAEQELEDLKRRIADKERQMKAKRQTGQGYSGVPARSRPNPAHGPVLRGLHRKQPPKNAAAESTQEADLFLKQVAAELPASRGIAPIQKTAAASQPVTKPASKAALLSQKSQPAAQAVKKAAAVAPAQATTATAQSGGAAPSVSAAKQQAVPEPAKAYQQNTTKPAVTRSGPKPSSPRPSPVVSPRKQGTSAAPSQQRGPLLATDSGEDMEIDEEAGKEILPPLPTGPFPSGLELATIDSSTQDVIDISAEERNSLLDELSGINARTDELRIQKRFLNDMFARVKQEYLERRLRQQQIEQVLGHKGNLAALPSTSTEEAGPSNALALRPADSSVFADQADASPGDHRQARKAELQSRAELHKARLDALNAKQRSTPSSAKPAALQPGVSPMTHKAIVDLTASPIPLKQTTAAATAAQTTTAAALAQTTAAAAAAQITAAAAAAQSTAAAALPPALPIAAVSNPLTASQPERLAAAGTTSAAAAAPKPSNAVFDKTEAVNPPTTKPAAVTINKDSKQRAQPAASQSAVGRRLDKPASSRGAAARSPSTSRQALKRRRSRSRSPAQGIGAGTKASRGQPGGQRQAVTSSQRHTTRSRSRSPPAKKGRHQQAQFRRRRHSSSTLSSSSSPGRHSPRSSSSSLSPVRRTLRQPRQSPSRSRHRGRRSPSPRARPRSARSPRAKGRSQRSPSPVAKNRRGGSPSRRPQRRAGGSGRSPARHNRQRKPVQVGGSTTPSTSRSPSPVRRRGPLGNPLPSMAEKRQRPRDSLQEAVMRRSSPVQQASTGQDRTAPSRKSQDLAALAVEPTTKPHHKPGQPAVPTAAAAVANGQLPPPPDRARAAQGPALPLPPPPQHEQRVEAVSPKPVQVPENAAAQALVGPEKKLVPAQQRFPSVASDPPPSTAAAAVQRDVNLLYVIEDREPLPQRLPSKSNELPAERLTKTATGPAPAAVASNSAVRPAAARDSTAADADNKKPSQSFDGKQSFISLDVEEAPVTGPPSVEQPSLADAKAAPKAVAQGDAETGQKLLAASRSRAAGKGNIQIVLATKHKQEATKDGFPFPSMFNALAAQGLPSQSAVSEQELPPLPLPQPAAVTDTSGHKYDSPLRVFRSYRLCDTFQTVSQLPLASPSFTHGLDPHWPLCTYDIRGSCRDAKCQYQHASDYQLENVAVLRDLHSQAIRAGSRAALPTLPGGEITAIMMTALTQQAIRGVPSPHIILPSPSPAPSPVKARAQLRIPRDRRRQLASEASLPLYMPLPSGPLATQSHPFSSQLLSSAQNERRGVAWQLLPGWEGYDSLSESGAAINTGSLHDYAARPAAAVSKPGDKMTGRYYQLATHNNADSPAATAATEAAAAAAGDAAPEVKDAEGPEADNDQRRAVLKELEQQTVANPGNQDVWLQYALEQIDYGAVDSMQGQKLMACLRCVSKGLEADPCFTWLWLLYLPLYGRHMTAKGGPSDVTKVAETSLTHSKHCYQLWLRVVQLQPDWQRRAVLLQRGLLALAQAQPGDYMGVSEEEAAGWTAMRSACVLDLVLRLLLLWTSVEAHDIVAGWIAELVKLVDQAKARVQSEDDPLKMAEHTLGGAARQALLQQLQDQPANAAVLWVTCAHLAAYNTLPSQVIHRLGFVQQPLVLSWQQAPPASTHSRVRSILTTAAAAGLGCLDLKTKCQVVDGVNGAFSDAEQGQSLSMQRKMARFYRKRRRSLSPDNAAPQSDRSSGSSSGSRTSSSDTSSGSSHDDRMRSHQHQQQYVGAISEGLQSEQPMDEPPCIDWAAVEAGGTLGGLGLVEQGFWELSKPAEPARGSPDFEEGEIRAVDLDMKRNHAAHWSFNLALYEALHGQAPQALLALQAAQKTAEGSLHLQQDVWREVLEFASAGLPSSAEPDMAASSPAGASVTALLGSQYPVGLRQKLHLLQQFHAWQREQAVLKPLAVPRLHIQDKRARALLEQPQFQDGEGMKDAALAMLAHVPPTQEVFLVEALVSAVPAAGAKAQLLLDLAARKPQDGQHASWMLPLAANALLNAAPPAAPHLWLQAVVLAEKHSVAAAKELSAIAVAPCCRSPTDAAYVSRRNVSWLLQKAGSGALHRPSDGECQAPCRIETSSLDLQQSPAIILVESHTAAAAVFGTEHKCRAGYSRQPEFLSLGAKSRI
ncbi:hypothetical protein WJX79_007018 [Trebouxia sp. C0005]